MQTKIRDDQVKENIERDEVITNISGKALITKVIAGANILLQSTGADQGTGDVTINVSSQNFVKTDTSTTIVCQHTFEMPDGDAPFLLDCQGQPGKVIGFDSDLLDGHEGSYYLNYNNLTNKPSGTSDSLHYYDEVLGMSVTAKFVNGLLTEIMT